MRNHEKLHKLALALSAIILITIIVSSVTSAATLNVGPKEKYKTIQKAANAAHDGDTIKVAPGTYKENVRITRDLTFLGTKYPKVNGFYLNGGRCTINGFSIQKYGFSSNYAGVGIIRNNCFYNCGIDLAGGVTCSSSIINNQIIGGTIMLYDTIMGGVTITGNTISKSKCGLYLGDLAGLPLVSKNTFKNCGYGVYIYTDTYPGILETFTGNKYCENKVNIGWGTDYYP